MVEATTAGRLRLHAGQRPGQGFPVPRLTACRRSEHLLAPGAISQYLVGVDVALTDKIWAPVWWGAAHNSLSPPLSSHGQIPLPRKHLKLARLISGSILRAPNPCSKTWFGLSGLFVLMDASLYHIRALRVEQLWGRLQMVCQKMLCLALQAPSEACERGKYLALERPGQVQMPALGSGIVRRRTI
jgi:hypothetical protein